jgi:predicted nucleic acid-binding protein
VTVFVDTNVLVYARDGSEPAKQAPAYAWVEHLWRSGAGRLSAQVLAEYYVTTTRKLRPGLAPNEARADIDDLRAWRPVAIDGNLLDSAWTLEDRFSLSFWDTSSRRICRTALGTTGSSSSIRSTALRARSPEGAAAGRPGCLGRMGTVPRRGGTL